MKSIALLFLFAAIRPAIAETRTVVYDFATKSEETRRRAYEQANFVNLAAQREPRTPLKGKVIQCLRGTSHLIAAEDETTILVDLLPGRGALPQGTTVSCSVTYIGIYEYHSVEGVQKRVKHWKEMTEAERAGNKWKTYAEFCDWLKLGHTCELRKSEPVRCTRCSGTGIVPGATANPGSRCPQCGGTGRDTLTTLYNLVWTLPPRASPPVAPPAAPPAAGSKSRSAASHDSPWAPAYGPSHNQE